MSVTTRSDAHHHDDDAQLASLGYTSDFKRDMNLWGNFSLGFTYLSPVVGVYSLFAFALAAGGPPMIWAVVLAAVGQLLVALVFGEVVAQFPVSGGVYPWARRLWGKKWAWLTGWVYMIALVVTIVLSVVLRALNVPEGVDRTHPDDYSADLGDEGVEEEIDPHEPAHA